MQDEFSDANLWQTMDMPYNNIVMLLWQAEVEGYV